MKTSLLSVGLAFVVACSGTSNGSSSSGGTSSSSSSSSGGNSTASRACLDLAEAVANAAKRCGGDYQQNYDNFVSQAANGSCNNIVSLRDESSLRSTCIPSFSSITCENLQAGVIDASCSKQLVRTASFQSDLELTPKSGWAAAGAGEE